MEDDTNRTVLAQFFSADGFATGPQLDLPLETTTEQLELLLNDLLAHEERLPYSFFVEEEELVESIKQAIQARSSAEDVVRIVYQPQAVFRVRAATRCTTSLEGHTEAVLVAAFSPDGRQLATGGGDATLRLWDILTETPLATLTGHTNWILCAAWSPDGKRLATGGMDKDVRIWDPVTGQAIGKPLKRHTKWVNALAWEPLHLNPDCVRVASAAKDGTIKVWDSLRGHLLFSLSGHAASVTSLKWSGQGFLISGSQDRTIRVYNASEGGKLVRVLAGHAHWVNSLSLNTDYVLRTGAHDHTGKSPATKEEAQQAAMQRWLAVTQGKPEKLVSCSDDHTLFLWEPASSKKPLIRMTGHQQQVNITSFSPDGRLIASASFDKSIKLWDSNGKFLGNLRGHVGAVYQIGWAADSRMLVSGSKDSTLKIWDTRTKKIKTDLPGHADEVYAVDWSPDGERLVSGSKDCLVKIWRH
jgi:ribosome assembly protein 4